MAVPPVSPSSPSFPTSSDPTNFTTIQASQDSLSSSSTRFLLAQYLAAIDVPTLGNIQQQQQNYINQLLSGNAQLAAAQQNLNSFSNIMGQVFEYDDAVQQVQDDATQVNTDLSNVNNSTSLGNDNSQISSLNTAATTYNSALSNYNSVIGNSKSSSTDITNATNGLNTAAAAYNTQVNDYFTYLNTNPDRSQDFNTYNADAQSYNDDVQTLQDLASIATQWGVNNTLPSTASLINFPNPSVVNPSSSGNNIYLLNQPYTTPPTNTPSSINYTSSALPTLSTSSLTQIATDSTTQGIVPPGLEAFLFAVVSSILQNSTSSAGVTEAKNALFGVHGKFIGLAPAQTSKPAETNSVASPNNPSSPGSITESYVNPFNLTTPTYTSNLYHSTYTKSFNSSTNFISSKDKLNVNVPESRTSSLVYPAYHFSTYAAVPPTISQLKTYDNKVSQNDQFAQGLISVGAAKDLNDKIQKGTFNEQIRTIVVNSTKGQNLTPAEIDSLTALTTAGFHANLLNLAANNIASSFQTKNLSPVLYTHVLTDLNIKPDQIARATSPASPSLQDVLRFNPLAAPVAKQSALNRSKELGIPPQKAVPLINKSVNATIKSLPVNQAQLKTTAYSNFLKSGATHTQALLLSSQVHQSFAREQTVPLSTPIPPNKLSLAPLQNSIPPQANTPVVNESLRSTVATNPTTVREFNNTFTQTQVQQGVNVTTAQKNSDIATHAALQQVAPTPPFEPANVQKAPLNSSLATTLSTPFVNPANPSPQPLYTPRQANTIAVNATNGVQAKSVPEYREQVRVNLVNQNVPPPVAATASENAFITTAPAPTVEQSRTDLHTNISNKIESLTGQKNDQLATDITDTVVGQNNSIRSHLHANLDVLNKYHATKNAQVQNADTQANAENQTETQNSKNIFNASNQEEVQNNNLQFNSATTANIKESDLTNDQSKRDLTPQLATPIHTQVQDSLYKDSIALNSTTAPAITSQIFVAHPSFGQPHKPSAAEFPQSLGGVDSRV